MIGKREASRRLNKIMKANRPKYNNVHMYDNVEYVCGTSATKYVDRVNNKLQKGIRGDII